MHVQNSNSVSISTQSDTWLVTPNGE
ncbi:MAG: hypothetical protein ACJASL_003401, partial [Paraglaciecola sp.]